MANEVRMWLGVITIAELADDLGVAIPPNRLNGMWRSGSWLNWPNTVEPTEKQWNAFRWFLRHTFCKKPKRVRRTANMKLDQRLGPWREAIRHIPHDDMRTNNWAYRRELTDTGTRIMQYMRDSHSD